MRQPEADAQPLPLPLPLPLNTLQAPVLHDARAGAGGSLRPSSDDLRAVGGDASAKRERARARSELGTYSIGCSGFSFSW
jgi:hypothetical protein